MSERAGSDIPLDSLEQHREELALLAESDMPISEYAAQALDLLESGGEK